MGRPNQWTCVSSCGTGLDEFPEAAVAQRDQDAGCVLGGRSKGATGGARSGVGVGRPVARQWS